MLQYLDLLYKVSPITAKGDAIGWLVWNMLWDGYYETCYGMVNMKHVMGWLVWNKLWDG
jgi:hypothetical protein